jgi:hypothetical protein
VTVKVRYTLQARAPKLICLSHSAKKEKEQEKEECENGSRRGRYTRCCCKPCRDTFGQERQEGKEG